MIKKLGWRRYLRLFWAVFRRKYFPKAEETGDIPAERGQGWSERQTFMLALQFGAIFICTPLACLLLVPREQLDMRMAMLFITFGLVFLAIPVSMVLALVMGIEKHADKILDEIKKI